MPIECQRFISKNLCTYKHTYILINRILSNAHWQFYLNKFMDFLKIKRIGFIECKKTGNNEKRLEFNKFNFKVI